MTCLVIRCYIFQLRCQFSLNQNVVYLHHDRHHLITIAVILLMVLYLWEDDP